MAPETTMHLLKGDKRTKFDKLKKCFWNQPVDLESLKNQPVTVRVERKIMHHFKEEFKFYKGKTKVCLRF